MKFQPGRIDTLTLPISEMKVMVKRRSLVTLLAAGAFPNEITSVVWKLYQHDVDPGSIEDPDVLIKLARLVDVLVAKVLVSPVVTARSTVVGVDESGTSTGEINVEDIPDLDKQVLFLYAQNVYRTDEEKAAKSEEVSSVDLASFRDESEGSAAGPVGAAVQSAAVDAAGDDREFSDLP